MDARLQGREADCHWGATVPVAMLRKPIGIMAHIAVLTKSLVSKPGGLAHGVAPQESAVLQAP